MQVNRIVKKGKKDVIVHFDEEKILILALEVFLKSGLKKSDNIFDDRFLFLIEQNKLFHIKQKAFRLLGRRQHSASELRKKLWNKDYEKKLIDEVINDLENNGYLDDEKFISEFVADKIELKSWSNKKVKIELIKKGISSNLIDSILIQQPKSSEFENAFKLGKKKYDMLAKRNTETRELKNKLFAYLFSKGFGYEMIKQVTKKLIDLKEYNN